VPWGRKRWHPELDEQRTSSWSNSGTINVNGNQSSVNLGGNFAPAAGTFTRTGGNINLVGTLNNTTLQLGSATLPGSWNLRGHGQRAPFQHGQVSANIAAAGASEFWIDVTITTTGAHTFRRLAVQSRGLQVAGYNGTFPISSVPTPRPLPIRQGKRPGRSGGGTAAVPNALSASPAPDQRDAGRHRGNNVSPLDMQSYVSISTSRQSDAEGPRCG